MASSLSAIKGTLYPCDRPPPDWARTQSPSCFSSILTGGNLQGVLRLDTALGTGTKKGNDSLTYSDLGRMT